MRFQSYMDSEDYMDLGGNKISSFDACDDRLIKAHKMHRNILAQQISEYVENNNDSHNPESPFIMLQQIKFYIKCMYDSKYYNAVRDIKIQNPNSNAYGMYFNRDRREDKKIETKYADMKDLVMNYLATLDYLDNHYIHNIESENGYISCNILSVFEHEILKHIDVVKIKNKRKSELLGLLEN